MKKIKNKKSNNHSKKSKTISNLKSKRQELKNSFLLEIGTEEIPSADFNEAMEQLYAAFIELKQEHNFRYDEKKMKVTGTPRRLSVYIPDFPKKQEDTVSKKVKGPPADIAFRDSKPTQAAIGFAKSQNVRIEDLIIEESKKGRYLFAVSTKPGKLSKEVLADVLPKLIGSIEFKKAMRWQDNIRFIRPIRWIVALLGSNVIKFNFGSVTSSNKTFGHRLLFDKEIKINNADEYKKAMQQANVVVDPLKRAQLIERSMKNLSGGFVDLDNQRIQKTLCEVINLIEKPSSIVGEFDKKFLNLPNKIVETVLQSHQRYFPILKKGKSENILTNKFLVISNGDAKKNKIIKHGHEKVVKARLEDAQFYQTEDLKKPLSGRVQNLEGIVFHERIGTLLDKTRRLQYLAKRIAKDENLSATDIDTATKAAKLAKADLLTSMVSEFDELQGYVGGQYALKEGKSKKIAIAIGEQYLPRSTKDELPKTKSGAMLGIADRIDTLCAYVAIGIMPTSAGDPYALRRQATGLVDIIFGFELTIDIRKLSSIAYKRLAKDFKGLDREKSVVDKVDEIVNQRIEFRLSQLGIDYDIIRAVAKLNTLRPLEFKQRVLALQLVRDTENNTLQDLVMICNRASSIADASLGGKISESLLREKEEKAFFKELVRSEAKLDTALSKNRYVDGIKILSAMKDTVDKFFDEVLVMAKDKAIKKNRHAILNKFVAACMKVADFSEIVKAD